MDTTGIFIVIILVLYIGSLLFIFMYSIAQAYLAYRYVSLKKHPEKDDEYLLVSEKYPLVTIQLPIYNEQYVTERLIDAVASIEYPIGKLEIQVLDDSTDNTTSIAIAKVKEWQERGLDISHIHRTIRTGYKAGALRDGLKTAKGEFIAIFDADFVPDKSFLTDTIAAFTNERIGMVQTRWDHLNRNHSILTQTQAFTIDAHFRIEQTGRNKSGCFINFNGTAGVWRKDCIIDAGNWQDDTLTEDLDLSYRAQIKGWNFVYLEDTTAPAELPPVMSAMKSQQYRWNKGAAETVKKLWPSLITSSLPFKVKWQGTFHLFNSTVFIAIILSAICSIPLLHFKQMLPEYKNLYATLSIFLTSFFIVAWIYYIVSKTLFKNRKELWLNYIKNFPLFLSVSMGMSLHNAVAVLEGYIGKKTPFIRTPKFSNNITNNNYVSNNINILSLVELFLVFYFAYGVYYAIHTLDFTMLPFHLMLTIGFGIVSYYTLFSNRGTISATSLSKPSTIGS